MSTNTQVAEETSTQTETKRKVLLGIFGNGRYSPAMLELYRDSQRLLKFTKEQAHVTAARLGIDAGQLQSEQVTLKYGRTANKDGLRTLKEVTKGMKLHNSWAMSIGSICSQLDETRKQGLVVVECTIEKSLLDAVDNAASKIQSAE